METHLVRHTDHPHWGLIIASVLLAVTAVALNAYILWVR